MINDFLGIAIVGATLSAVFQLAKKYFGDNKYLLKLYVIVASILVGAGYVWLRGTDMWETVLGILAAASTVYALFFKK